MDWKYIKTAYMCRHVLQVHYFNVPTKYLSVINLKQNNENKIVWPQCYKCKDCSTYSEDEMTDYRKFQPFYSVQKYVKLQAIV